MSRILLIEPDYRLAGLYRKFLGHYGHEVAVAGHAQDAVFASDESKPDLVLLEVQLSGHSGIEFLYEFRSYPEWQEIPVVLLTMVPPHMLQITPQIMEDFGIVRCLYKPATTLMQLHDAVKDSLLLTV